MKNSFCFVSRFLIITINFIPFCCFAQSFLWFTAPLQLTSINQTMLDFTWKTNITSSTAIKYGITSALELGTLNAGGSTINHGITLTGLSPAAIYYVKAFSVAGTDTAVSTVKIVCTSSASSGIIRVYFNRSVDNSASAVADAIAVSEFPDTIISYIDNAQSTLDICLYNNSNSNIVSAINAAYLRGVTVRYIADLNTANSALNNLNPNIKILKGNTSGLMHNKFTVIDRNSSSGSWVITGSINWTYQSFYNDYNNMELIQDQSLAQAYTREFEEMWGGNSAIPDSLNAKFGSAKTDNTPHEFRIGGRDVQLYFSPSDYATGAVMKALASANSDVSFALLTLTRKDLADSLISAKNKGCLVQGAIEETDDPQTEYNYLLANNMDVRSHMDPAGLLHHKYCIVDATLATSGPLVITGSHNWTLSAEDVNDENMLVVHDNVIANMFLEEFKKRFDELPQGVQELPVQNSMLNASVFPNPTKGDLGIRIKNLGFTNAVPIVIGMKFFNLSGREVFFASLPDRLANPPKGRICPVAEWTSPSSGGQAGLIHLDLPNGIYFYIVESRDGNGMNEITGRGKLILERP